MATTTEKADVDLLKLVAAYAHEIGHAAVALWFGCEVRIEVEVSTDTSWFDGACHVRHPAGDLAACALRPIGLAGVVAEYAYQFGWDSPRLSIEAMSDALRAGQLDLSQTDLQMADGWTDVDMALAFEVVGGQWEWIVSEAECRARQDHGGLFEVRARSSIETTWRG